MPKVFHVIGPLYAWMFKVIINDELLQVWKPLWKIHSNGTVNKNKIRNRSGNAFCWNLAELSMF